MKKSDVNLAELFNQRAVAMSFINGLSNSQAERETTFLQTKVTVQDALNGILQSALLEEDLDLALAALKKGANPNAHNKQDRTALNIAVLSGNKEAIDLVMIHGAKLDACTYPAIFSAVESYSLDVVQKMLLLGSDVRKNTYYGNTALHLAAALPKALPILEYFIDNLHCDVNAPGNQNRTPLFNAIYFNDNFKPNVEGVKYLLSRDARTDRYDTERQTPYTYARDVYRSRAHYGCKHLDEQRSIYNIIYWRSWGESYESFMRCNLGAPLPR